MARLLRERGSPGHSRRISSSNPLRLSVTQPPMSSSSTEYLPSPFGVLGCNLSDAERRETAYEIFVAACRTTSGKPLTFIPQAEKTATPPSAERSPSPSPSMQRSLTSTAASKMKKALGLKPSKKSPGRDSSPSRAVKRPATVGELIRVQMGASEQADSRIRRGLLRIAASQLGRRIESIVLPLELLQQFKASDFADLQEYEAWRSRNLKVLEAGLLLHPFVPLEKSDGSSQRLRHIIRGASENPIETGKNSESMQALRSTVMSLAYRTTPGSSCDACHWADGSPLNLNLYQMLLETLFDYVEGSIVEEIDEVLELFKKTWAVLGINQMIHNLCFLWFLFHCFVTTGQTDSDLLLAADNLLMEVAKDSKTTKDPIYAKILSSTLSSIMGWTEKRLLAYHETFSSSNIELMQCVVSLGVSAAKILVDDISHEYRRRRREEVDVARTRIDAYIRSSLKTAFAQTMEKVDSIRRSSKTQNANLPVLAILAKDIGDLAKKEKDIFSPILKRWHPLAAGVAVATLHSCYGNELKQFICGVKDLTFDSIQVLKAAQNLEKDLVLIAVEDSVDSEDGGKGLIREMLPYEAESVISSLTKSWVRARVEKLRELVDRNLQQEMWNPRANKENFAPSAVEVLRLVDESLDAFFQLPIPFHAALLPDLIVGLDICLQYYVAKAKAGCGTRNSFLPELPALTRVEIASKLWKKKDKSQNPQRRNIQNGSLNGENSCSLPQFCVRLNTLHHIQTELLNLEKKITNCIKDLESSPQNITNPPENKFELTLSSSLEGIQQLCETTAYKVVFFDLSHVLWNFLYVKNPSSSRIDSFLKELDPKLETISTTMHNRVRNRVITALMKASFDGFLLVLLAGGPSRAYTRHDSQILEEDFKALKDLYLADGDGLPLEVVEKAATQVQNILPLFRAETESLIVRFKQVIIETYGSSAKSRYPMPPTSGHWSPAEANTILRVLCYRNDDAASKFLKKTYNLPKKL
ncbi:uncharacterized protein LOC110024356 [Phalaenopsis equestris]|uniref:uncharacterized protein LOC110024356 n=1 Tax=Phalaenopsis equestris TaxID=78828 RepID=UPI0009E1CBE4|nr:uncharacterized protein LOC110024356 [Phalaenopsis equestris]